MVYRLVIAVAASLLFLRAALADSIQTLEPTHVHETTAFLGAGNGSVAADGHVTIEYGTTTAYGSSDGTFTYNAGYTGGVGAPVSGLTPGTTYHVRASFAVGSTTTATGNDVTFRTAAPGGVLLDSADTFAGASSFAVMWPSDANGSDCGSTPYAFPEVAVTRYRTYVFTNATTTSTCVTVRYASLCATLGSAAHTIGYSGGDPATGLIGLGAAYGNGEYQFTVGPGAAFSVAMVDDGTCAAYTLHVDSSALAPPTSTTGPAFAGPHSATLAGTVSAALTGTAYDFEWGPTSAYGSQTPATPLAANAGPQAVTATVSGLEPGQTYHYRLVVNGPGGASTGADATFTTPLSAPAMTLLQSLVAIDRKGHGTLSLGCPASTASCAGSATITTGKRRHRKRVALLTFSGSGTLDLPLALTRYGRMLVRHKKNVQADLTISAVDSEGDPVDLTTTCRLVKSN